MVNILMVEDNSGFRVLFKELLNETSLKFKIVETDNPMDGLEELTKNNYKFDFLICDFYLPIQNGNDFLEVVKSHNSNIVCILISADEFLKTQKILHVDHFFVKRDLDALIQFISKYKKIKDL